LRELGYEVFIDSYLSMMVKHVGNYAFWFLSTISNFILPYSYKPGP
jgi:hypothetical protein